MYSNNAGIDCVALAMPIKIEIVAIVNNQEITTWLKCNCLKIIEFPIGYNIKATIISCGSALESISELQFHICN
jgi:hypothetical protein